MRIDRNRVVVFAATVLLAAGALAQEAPKETPAAAAAPAGEAVTLPAAEATPAATAPAPEVAAKAPEPAAWMPPYIWKFQGGASLRIYGRLELLTYYDTSIPYISDWLAYAQPAGTFSGDNGSFSMSVRASPIGIHLNVPEVTPGWAFNARVEVDFSGGFLTGAMSAYSPLMRLKQAWVSIDSDHVSIMAGQNFGVFNPLFPDEASWIALGTSGNPWIRLPQIRLTLNWEPIKFELAAARPMGGNEVFNDSVNDMISDGELSKMPFFMGRLGYFADYGGGSTLGIGFSGVYGRERIHRDYALTHTTGDKATETSTLDQTTNVWMAGADAKLTTKYVDLMGEFYIGDNLNQFFAGVLQGVTIIPAALDKATDKVVPGQAWAIRDLGGWGQITVKPVPRLFLYAGAGIDKPRVGDLYYDRTDKKAVVPREYNLTAYGSVNYKFFDVWLVGAEVSYTRTKYLDDNGTNYNVRAMLKTAFIF